ncbi:hypothetical protein EGI26_02900 [Lacihabitans sp. CCS-44]|uniref:hypothetical protein n=1 Tax=Lacihabitans sp. CCS-44 TaxID=2487331 RepID=UPI0020CC4E9C|nr:hypothetical protein [Lacihabitans sp. CCS-44]MCP9754110.1 hypothetical protein [Lacihabitans sp. CCS-44]
MKTPLVFKLILLLVLAWRLIISNKKTKKPSEKGFLNLLELPAVQLSKPSKELEPKEAVKRFYRDVARENPEVNQLYFICFLAEKLQKHFAKRGIFRLFWYDQHLVLSFYQSLKLLNLEKETILFEKILTNLNPVSFIKVSNNETLEPNSFLATNPEFDLLYVEFDKIFDMDKYCQALVNQFYAN